MGRSPNTFQKRQREYEKKQKAEEKRKRREAQKNAAANPTTPDARSDDAKPESDE